MTFAKRLRQTRREAGMSQRELAEIAGITARSIQNYESGRRMPNSLQITALLAEALSVTAEYLLGGDDGYVDIPLVGDIACGPLNFAEEYVEARWRLPTELVGEGTFFMLRAVNDSMIDAGIDDGDLIMIRKQEYANAGDIVAVLSGGETTLKRYYPEPEKRRVRLHPENQSMQDIIVRDCAIQGVAVKVIKDL